MLFMGEEWGATTPWQFFTSHPEPELAAAVASGRRAEFASHGWPEGDVPDPQDPQTYLRSRLDWAELDKPEHAETFAFYKRLIALRKSRADLSDPRLDKVDVTYGHQFLVMRRGGTAVAANLAPQSQRITLPGVVRSVLLASETGATVMRDGVQLPPESAVVVALS
jgi:maltooligosyltrehalose trehalohydrolase